MLGSLLGSLPGSLGAVQNEGFLRRPVVGALGYGDQNYGDESCVTRFSRGADEKRRGIPATVRKVVWPGFPGERKRSAAGSRNVNESCVASLFFIGVGGSGRRPSRIRRPRRACGELSRTIRRRYMKYSTFEQLWGRGAGAQNRDWGADHTESVVYWCKVNNSCEEPSSGQGAESHEIMEKTM